MDEMANAVLIKIDRNGSKHWRGMVKCDRCSGRGLYATGNVNGQPRITPVDNGICHKCGGAGQVEETWIERTPEYEAKLAERREKARAKKAAEREAQRVAEYDQRCAETLKKNGFNTDGVTFLFLGETYSRKDEIKAAGGKFDVILGWHIDHQVDGFQFLQIRFEEVADFTPWGWMSFKDTLSQKDIDIRKREALNKLNNVKPSEYIGAVGDKITVKVTLVRRAWYEVNRGEGKGYWGFLQNYTMHVYTFKDEAGNLIVWKTQAALEYVVDDECHRVEEGETVQISGRIKELSEYNGDKQTVLTRCKVKAA